MKGRRENKVTKTVRDLDEMRGIELYIEISLYIYIYVCVYIYIYIYIYI